MISRPAKKAIIVGGSMGGLFAGLHLLKAGWDVQIYERVAVPLSGRGAGIVTHPELLSALTEVGIKIDQNLGVEVPGRVAFGRDGESLGFNKLPQLLTSWSRLYDILHAHFPEDRYHRGAVFTRCETDDDGVTAHFEDRPPVKGDVLIGADGFRSAVRAQFDPAAQPLYAGYVAWRGLVVEKELSDRAREEMFPYFAFCLAPSEQILGYPVAGEDNNMAVGERRYNFVWYRPADASEKLPWLLTDREGACNGVSIAPNLIRDEVADDMRTAAERLLSPQFAELVAKTEQPFIQPIYDLTISRMNFGRVAIMGDAAFVARPHVGMGVTKAAADAVRLAAHLAQTENVEAALSNWHDERFPIGTRVVDRARHLGAYMQAQLKTPEEQRLAEKHRSPSAVMSETASDAFLTQQD